MMSRPLVPSRARRRAATTAWRCLASALLLSGCGEDRDSAGVIEGPRRAPAAIEASAARQDEARRGVAALASASGTTTPRDAARPRQILFGDLHVHTSYSIDAFLFSLPLFGGEGAHPPADACDFARYCSALDFFSINDHAESLTPERWEATKESIRRCNVRAGDPAHPDLVAFVGWEWTQVGTTPETHYGHRNIIFPGLADEELPARPITALPDEVMERAPPRGLLGTLGALRLPGLRPYADFLALIDRMAAVPNCERGIDVRRLPHDCRENASTPAELFEKLRQWGFDALVIPHGLSWGLHAPAGSRLDHQLSPQHHDPDRQRLLEIFSGHGNAEEYRPWKERVLDDGGTPICPPPSADFLPCCWQAGEIMRARCADLPAAECEARVEEARRLALAADVAPHLVFPDTQPEDWLDCDQCRDCFKGAFAPRPGATAQYSVALSRFEAAAAGRDGSRPLRFRWGFIGSSDDHTARPGTGYKQVGRRVVTDARGLDSPWIDWLLRARIVGTQADPQRAQSGVREPRSFGALLDVERVSSFMYPGGLVAVHATGRDRAAVWEALRRREVYATSGPRILLWFDLVNGPDGRVSMGGEAVMTRAPEFEVRAVGAFVQRPGCPEESVRNLAPGRLERLCRGECHHPGARRHAVAAIEVVRIRPQREPGEDVGPLIEDPWRRFPCADPAGCVARFTDPEFAAGGRDAVYYVRALQEETPAINGANLRTRFDAEGRVLETTPCHGNHRTPADDDCLAMVEERAWSSPIFVDHGRPGRDP
jgi:hypothetical protein